MNRILVVGYGSIGKRHVKNLLNHTDSQIIIYTKRQDLDFKTKHVIVSNSLEYCLSQNPNIGFICNETAKHVPVSIKLAKAGMDLFIDKPLSHSMKGISTLNKTVKEKKLVTQMGCQLRFHVCIKKIRQLLAQKKIGKIISVQAENGSYLPDWHPYEDYRKGYAAKKNLGGGVVLTQIHDIDYLYWFFGNPKSVFSINGKFSELSISVEDYSASLLQFKNKITVELHQDFFQGPEYRGCKLKGTNGVISWNSINNEIKFYNNRTKKWKIIMKLKNFEKNQMYIDEIKHFLKCVKNRRKTINNLDDGINTMNIAIAIKKSGRYKKTIKTD